MKLQIEFSCKQVKQIFSVSFDREEALEAFDAVDEAGLEVAIVGIVSGEGILGLRRLGFRVERVRYDSPHPGGYEGPERTRD